MGTAIGDIIEKKEARIQDFANSKIAIDAFNTIYQFLTILRGPDGSLLTDRNGNVTSHLNGLLSRCLALMREQLELVFVFDGTPPELKKKEREKRKQLKQEAQKKYEKAVQEQDTENMYKYGMRTARITKEIIDDAKKLLDLLGIPYVQAPSEGEAQAAFMQKKGDVDYIASQDYDSVLFGTGKLVRNLAISPRRKKSSALSYERLSPEIIYLKENLDRLELTQEQMIIIGILVGTDFDNGGIKGIGPKKALKLVKNKTNYEELFSELKWDEHFDYDWKDVYNIFAEMPFNEDYNLKWKEPEREGLIDFLCNQRDFSRERVDRELKKLDELKEKKKQKGLGEFF